MIFDLACRIAEKSVPELERWLRKAALFVLPAAPHEFLPKEWGAEEAEFFQENFFLPFPVTAVEDRASLTLLIDLVEGAVGADKPRAFIEIMSMNMSSLGAFREHDSRVEAEALRMMANAPKDSVIVTFGDIEVAVGAGSKVAYKGRVDRVVVATPDKVLYQGSEDFSEVGGHDVVNAVGLRNAGTCWQEIMYINNPERFVVEIVNTGAAKQHLKGKKIKRSHQRPQYTLMTVGELRKTMGVYDKTDRHQTPHWRRKHFRRLVDDRYVNKKGQVVVVKQAWVGPEEATVGRRHYKVLLDR